MIGWCRARALVVALLEPEKIDISEAIGHLRMLRRWPMAGF